MSYTNAVRQHINDHGDAVPQVVAPPDFPGDMNPPMNNVATSRYAVRCSNCATEIPTGTPYLVGFCDGCHEPDIDDHTFVIGTCCDRDFADELAGNFLAIDAPLPLGKSRHDQNYQTPWPTSN